MSDTPNKLSNDCFLHDKDRMTHEEAITHLKKVMLPIANVHEIDLRMAMNTILAQDIIAPRNIPAFDNSAVDGYAFNHSAYLNSDGEMKIEARIVAGDTAEHNATPNGAVRIFTGAKIPKSHDSVAMQEDCKTREEDGLILVSIPQGLKQGANCRLAGEDVKQGETIAHKGTRLRAQDLAAIASTGRAAIKTYTPLKIGLLSSGDEVLRPGETFQEGKVYDANHFMLLGLLEQMEIDADDLGIVPDDLETTKQTLEKAANEYDVIISTGGASKGEEDHFIDALDDLGKRHFWQLAVKPGRPMCFGQIGNTPVFTLPGNPVAAFVCFMLYVQPSLRALGGATWQTPTCYQLPSGFQLTSKPDRREFLRGIVKRDENGQQAIFKYQRDGSGLISSLRESTGFIEISEGCTKVDIGDAINFIPYSELGL